MPLNPKNKYGGNLLDEQPKIIEGTKFNSMSIVEHALNVDPHSVSHVDPLTLETAPHIAARRGYYEIFARLMVAPGVDLKAKDHQGLDVLDAASEGGHSSIMDLAGENYHRHPAPEP